MYLAGTKYLTREVGCCVFNVAPLVHYSSCGLHTDEVVKLSEAHLNAKVEYFYSALKPCGLYLYSASKLCHG
eukprot:6009485-Ditylum_brightwellii.AAC.1